MFISVGLSGGRLDSRDPDRYPPARPVNHQPVASLASDQPPPREPSQRLRQIRLPGAPGHALRWHERAQDLGWRHRPTVLQQDAKNALLVRADRTGHAPRIDAPLARATFRLLASPSERFESWRLFAIGIALTPWDALVATLRPEILIAIVGTVGTIMVTGCFVGRWVIINLYSIEAGHRECLPSHIGLYGQLALRLMPAGKAVTRSVPSRLVPLPPVPVDQVKTHRCAL